MRHLKDEDGIVHGVVHLEHYCCLQVVLGQVFPTIETKDVTSSMGSVLVHRSKWCF